MVTFWALCALASAQEPEPAPRDLFSTVETRDLPNGLRVHRVPVPGSALTRTSLTVPVGRHHDPPGQEQLAHLLEHMLLSVEEGLTEEEFQGLIKDQGGGFNGFTSDRTTHYYVELDQAQGLDGVEWLYRVVRPKPLSEASLRTQRNPVLLEVDARQFTLADYTLHYVFDPPALRPPGFWRQAFGLVDPHYERIQNPYRSVRNITAASLKDFYETWYSPATMTLTIAGDEAADAVWARVDETWARLPARPVTPQPFTPEVTDHARSATWFHFKPQVSYARHLFLQDLDGDETQVLLFLESWLRQRLQRALRGGEEKATYSVRVTARHKGDAWDFEIKCELDPDRYDDAVAMIEAELDALTAGSLSDEIWVQEREELVRRTLNRAQASHDFTGMVFYDLHRRDLFDGLPNLPARYAAMDQAQVAAFLTRHRLPGREGLRLWRPFPLSPVLLGVIFGLLGAGIWRDSLSRWRAPLDLSGLRYVARVRTSGGENAAALGGLAVLIALGSGARIAWYWAYWVGVATVDHYAVRFLADGLTVALWTLGILWLLAHVPRKVLVFEDGVALKALWVRVWWTPLDQITSARVSTLADARTDGPVLALTWGRGVLIVRKHGRSWFVRARDPAELAGVITGLLRTR